MPKFNSHRTQLKLEKLNKQVTIAYNNWNMNTNKTKDRKLFDKLEEARRAYEIYLFSVED